MVSSHILERIGNTPLVRLDRVCEGLDAEIFVKCEFLNPSGSVKDRAALNIVLQAEKRGDIEPGWTLIENSSGNFGQSLAMIAAVKGYRAVLVIPDKNSDEKMNMIRAYGGEVVITPAEVAVDDPRSAYSVVKQIHHETPDSYITDQIHNPDNMGSHYASTGPEIWDAMSGDIDFFVAGVGTGGTCRGVSRYLKEKDPSIATIGLDPVGSVYHEHFHTGKKDLGHLYHEYKLEGIGEKIVLESLEYSHVDDMMQIPDRESFLMARRVAREEGLFIGGSAGGAIWASLEVARKNPGKRIVAILPDSGNRYVSKIYNDGWMRENGYLE